MRFGIDVSQHQLTWDEILRRTRKAEDAGFDGAWVFDHFKPLYADPKGPCLEGWTLLAGLAAHTSRIRLGTLVTGVTYRHPSVLAAECVTVDHISKGRLEMAIGAAWFDTEHQELGIDFPGTAERIERLEEAITVIDLLMTTDDVSFEGRHYKLDGATYNPKPVQSPRPPLWIGAGGFRKMLPLTARVADVWHGFGDLETLDMKMRVIDESAEAAGRDPREILRSTSLSISEPLDVVRRRLDALTERNFGYLVVSWPGDGDPMVDRFIEEVMPAYVS
jgi:F420-dependent oxidoreductase-like protein